MWTVNLRRIQTYPFLSFYTFCNSKTKYFHVKTACFGMSKISSVLLHCRCFPSIWPPWDVKWIFNRGNTLRYLCWTWTKYRIFLSCYHLVLSDKRNSYVPWPHYFSMWHTSLYSPAQFIRQHTVWQREAHFFLWGRCVNRIQEKEAKDILIPTIHHPLCL